MIVYAVLCLFLLYSICVLLADFLGVVLLCRQAAASKRQPAASCQLPAASSQQPAASSQQQQQEQQH